VDSKAKIPNHKHQIPNKFQMTIFNDQNAYFISNGYLLVISTFQELINYCHPLYLLKFSAKFGQKAWCL